MESLNFELNVSAMKLCFYRVNSITDERETRMFSDSMSAGKENNLGTSSGCSPCILLPGKDFLEVKIRRIRHGAEIIIASRDLNLVPNLFRRKKKNYCFISLVHVC